MEFKVAGSIKVKIDEERLEKIDVDGGVDEWIKSGIVTFSELDFSVLDENGEDVLDEDKRNGLTQVILERIEGKS